MSTPRSVSRLLGLCLGALVSLQPAWSDEIAALPADVPVATWMVVQPGEHAEPRVESHARAGQAGLASDAAPGGTGVESATSVSPAATSPSPSPSPSPSLAAALQDADLSEPDTVGSIPDRAPEPASPAVAADASAPNAPEIASPGAPVAPTAATDDPEPLARVIEQRLADLKSTLPARLPRSERDGLAAHYAAAQFRPVWVANGTWNAAANAVIARLRNADEDGLDPTDYPVPALASAGAAERSDSLPDLAEAEVKLSAAALLYARDARGGRIDTSRLSALITPKLELPSAPVVITRLAAAADPGVALAAFNPAYPGYAALRGKLAETRANRPAGALVRLPVGRSAAAVPRVASLDGAVPRPPMEADLIANMERWRWLPAEVAPRYIAVNLPAFRLELIENGRAVHETRVIVGKPETPSPVFSGEMEYAVVNPSWYIPPSIMKKEILPGLAADPTYAEKRGYEVIRRGNQVYVRQPPGERNALGFIKFMFPNAHAVYLHDTPNRRLFSASQRAFSHGCVRVEQPFALAEFVLGRAWPEGRLRKLIGQGERTIRMAAKLPVHLSYFTLMVDGAGELHSYGDLYGIHRRVRLALGLGA